MTFTLWLSADEEQILERIMRLEGTRNKQEAVIQAIREKDAQLAAKRLGREHPGKQDLAGRRDLTVAQDVTDNRGQN